MLLHHEMKKLLVQRKDMAIRQCETDYHEEDIDDPFEISRSSLGNIFNISGGIFYLSEKNLDLTEQV